MVDLEPAYDRVEAELHAERRCALGMLLREQVATTSAPARAKCQAVDTPITPAPRTATFMMTFPKSDVQHGH